jgi:tRNA G37 N-methylase Trm5
LSKVPYFPTPYEIVRRMLRLANVKPGEVVYDLGAGDGRIVIEAAKNFGARGVAIELHPRRVEKIRENVRLNEVKRMIDVVQGDFYRVSVNNADVVTLYLLTETNAILRPKLERELKPGSRVVAHDFPVPGWAPKKVIYVRFKDGVHKIYLYESPFRKSRQYVLL